MARCSQCGFALHASERVVGKVTGGLLGSFAGPVAYSLTGSKRAAGAASMLFGLAGAGLGHVFVDSAFSAVCPRCGGS